ncbi:nucleoside diphosphate kinase [Halteromyces radiatus]|uniref:nucleoside diphosphate kinase n=1 Tax=Halteromyces radiatus TaxID=101107 RepID=UPI00221EA27A|nr:nucleoside diphosphate kinase [Halteromyces radiatus]KAI8097159.1 nucleoside diphosphate kinase [Halteromyces radiatus]
MTIPETTAMDTSFSKQEQQPEQVQGKQQDVENTGKSYQRTLTLIKPDAVQANHQQDIIDKITQVGFTIIQQKQIQFTLDQARLFYREHEGKSFYPQLTEWMSR